MALFFNDFCCKEILKLENSVKIESCQSGAGPNSNGSDTLAWKVAKIEIPATPYALLVLKYEQLNNRMHHGGGGYH